VGARTIEAYLRSAYETIQAGQRFVFRRGTRLRVGYYHRKTRRLVVLTDDEDRILSLDRQGENHVRRLPDSTYSRE